MDKPKLFFHTDFVLRKTGFAKHAKLLLSYLYRTGKYDLVHYCCDVPDQLPDLQRTPWKSIGCMHSFQHDIEKYLSSYPPEQREMRMRLLAYGEPLLNKTINAEKPDFYFGIQDIWGVDFSVEQPWFSKINSVIWTTLDSLPILKTAVDKAPRIKNYWIWSDFATKALHQMGFNHVRTVHGAVESEAYKPLSEEEKTALRKRFNVDLDTFIVGFVFRNQLRKSVPNLLQGYKLWKDRNPGRKSALLLHTYFPEGWKIMERAKETGIEPKEILGSYICRNCRSYQVKPYVGEDQNCPFCGDKGRPGGGQMTANVGLGVTETQLNEIYNLMDVYCHPFTSGGQEIPIQEAKFAGLITLVTNYSCGEDLCVPSSGSLALDWSEYREWGTEFVKASTLPESIRDRIQEVFDFSKEKRAEMGLIAREWAMKNYTGESIGKIVENFVDSQPKHSYEFAPPESKSPDAEVKQDQDNAAYIKSLYKLILKMDVDENDSGFKHWMDGLSKGMPRADIENYFRQTALNENNKTKNQTIEDFLDKEDFGKRILYVMPESIGDVFLSTALFKSIKEEYPEYNLYVATKPENFNVLDCNPFIHKAIPYLKEMESEIWLEGSGDRIGEFAVSFLPFVGTQRQLNYLHGGKSRVSFNLLEQV